MRNKIMLLGYDKNNNLLFKVKKQKALFVMDFNKEQIRLLKGFVPKSIKKKLRKYMHEHYDLNFI